MLRRRGADSGVLDEWIDYQLKFLASRWKIDLSKWLRFVSANPVWGGMGYGMTERLFRPKVKPPVAVPFPKELIVSFAKDPVFAKGAELITAELGLSGAQASFFKKRFREKEMPGFLSGVISADAQKFRRLFSARKLRAWFRNVKWVEMEGNRLKRADYVLFGICRTIQASVVNRDLNILASLYERVKRYNYRGSLSQGKSAFDALVSTRRKFAKREISWSAAWWQVAEELHVSGSLLALRNR